jgi:hypothetical protein
MKSCAFYNFCHDFRILRSLYAAQVSSALHDIRLDENSITTASFGNTVLEGIFVVSGKIHSVILAMWLHID